MAKCLLFLILLFSIYNYRASAQICTGSYYQTSLHHAGDTYFSSLTLLPGGNAIVSQYANKNFNLIKITASGDTLWNKTYLTSNAYDINYHQATKLDNDGTLLCLVKIDELLKIDTNGVVLSARHIQHPDYRYAYDIEILDNGDKILLFNSLGAVDGGTIIRLSGDLQTVKWSKDIKGNFGHFTNALLDNDKIIIAADNSLCRFDPATGALLGFTTYSMGNLPSRIKKIYKCGDGYLATVTLYDNQNGYYGYARFSSSLSLLSVRQLQYYNDYVLREYAFSCAPQPDGSFYMTYGGFADVSLSYINNKDEVQWAERFPGISSYPDDMQQSDDALYIAGSDNYRVVSTNTNETQTDIIKCGRNGFYTGCNAAATKELVFTSYPFTQATTLITANDVTVSISSFKVPVSTYGCDILAKCVKTITCDKLKIQGNTSVCSNASVLLTGSKNQDCSLPVQWSSFPQQGCTLSPNDDSTLSATFSESGIYNIYGAINTLCGATIKDSIKITVNLLHKLDLGNDTFICSNTITLHAGNQFQAYNWQDGSTDSVFTATKPGKYYATVADFCGNAYSDTLNINAGPAYSFTAGSDTSKCNTDTLLLSATEGFINYQWSTLDHIVLSTAQSVNVSPDKTIQYIAQAEKPLGCFVFDTVQVIVTHSAFIYLGSDTSFCYGDSVTLTAGDGFSSYRWSTGETKAAIVVGKAGTYTVRVKDADGCYAADTLSVSAVYPLPKTELARYRFLCAGSPLLLDAGSGFSTYLWQDNSQQSQYTVTNPGTYWVKIKDARGCSNTDTITVAGPVALPDNFLPTDTTICTYDDLVLQPSRSFSSYLWSAGTTQPSLPITSSGTYWLQVTDNNGCTNKNYVQVLEKECSSDIYFPSAFTPNFDGHNDVFRPKVSGKMEQYKMTIYNRWGKKLFETSNWQQGWNGFIDSYLQDVSSYVWIAIYKLKGKATVTAKGMVTLLK